MARQLSPNDRVRRWRLWGFGVMVAGVIVAGLIAWSLHRATRTPFARYVVRPEISVNGVAVGSSIRLNGVSIGRVTKVGLWADAESGRLRPEIVLTLDTSKDPSFLNLNEKVAEGLRVQFVPVNPASGFLEVDLVWSPGSPQQVAVGGSDELPWQLCESQLKTAQVIPLVQKLAATDFRVKVDAFVENLAQLEARVKSMEETPNAFAVKSERLRQAVQSVERAFGSDALGSAQTHLADLREGLRMAEAVLDALDRDLVRWPEEEGMAVRNFSAACRQSAQRLREALPEAPNPR